MPLKIPTPLPGCAVCRERKIKEEEHYAAHPPKYRVHKSAVKDEVKRIVSEADDLEEVFCTGDVGELVAKQSGGAEIYYTLVSWGQVCMRGAVPLCLLTAVRQKKLGLDVAYAMQFSCRQCS